MTDMAVPLVIDEVKLIALNIPCDKCKAVAGEPCRNQAGEPLQKVEGLPVLVHVARITPVWVIYQIGYRHGCRDTRKKKQ